MEMCHKPKSFDIGISVPEGQSLKQWEDVAIGLVGKTNYSEIVFRTEDELNMFPPKTILCEGFYSGEGTPFDFIMMYSFSLTWCFFVSNVGWFCCLHRCSRV